MDVAGSRLSTIRCRSRQTVCAAVERSIARVVSQADPALVAPDTS